MERCYFEYCLGKTKDETLNEAIIHKRDIISTITEEMLADQGYDPAILLQLYKKADELEQAIMDSVLMCLCGWSMESIIKNSV